MSERPLPMTSPEWLAEIKLAVTDARKAKLFGWLLLRRITDANLFHLAPVVALKFRGRDPRGLEAKRVTEAALANYVANSDSEGVERGLERQPLLAFCLCYVTSHLALDLVNEQQAETNLNYCEEHLKDLETNK